MSTLLHVLMVEDSEDDALLILRELRRCGYDLVMERVDTADAMQTMLHARNWDIILADFSMPNFGAPAALALLKESGIDLPFIIISGSIGEEIAVMMMKAGAHDYLMKCNLTRLAPAIDRELLEAGDRRKRRQAEAALRESEERYRNLFENAHDMIQSVAPDGRFQFVNRAWLETMGYTLDEVKALTIFDIILPELLDSCTTLFHKVIHEGQYGNLETTFIAKSGQYVDVEGNISCHYTDGAPVASQGVFRNITHRKAQTAALEHQATHDSLTGLPNRFQLSKDLNQVVEKTRLSGKRMAFMLIDLDRFKEVNDALGHQAGDILLKQIAPRLCDALDITANVARLGGDEFGLLLPHINSIEEVIDAAKKILSVIGQPFNLEGLKIQIGASIGIALYPDHSDDPHSMMRCADIAMYLAKKTGGGYSIYNPTLDIYSPRRLSLITSLRVAIQENQLVLYYQPKQHIKTKNVIGMEALVRWQHPQHGLVAPNEFIPLAEVSDLIMPLTHWVIDNTLQQLREWQDMGIDTKVAANISARNLQDNDLPNKIATLLEQHQIAPYHLELEITESAIIVDPLRALETLCRIHELGVTLSIDDFGTGYTSLSHLRKLPITTLKIDFSFIHNMLKSKDDAGLVQSIIHLSHNLGMDVIAEGVEDQATLDMLKAFECDVAQGYFVCPPMTAEQVTQWLKTQVIAPTLHIVTEITAGGCVAPGIPRH